MRPAPLPCLIASLLALVASCPARAQFPTPRPVDDIDIPAPKPTAPSAEPAPEPAEEPAAVEDGSEEEVFIPGRSSQRPRAEDAAVQGAGGVADPSAARGRGEDAGEEPADAGSAAPLAEEAQNRPSKPIIQPPPDGAAQLSAAFVAHQKAVVERSPRAMLEAERRIEALRDELGLENLFAFSSALSHQAEQLFKSEAPEALRRAVLSAELSPDSPYAQWTAARAALRDEPLGASRWLQYAAQALQASWREPRWRMAGLAEAALAILAALGAAGALTVLLIFARHARYFFHDFRHLFPEGASAWQTTPLALLLLALPLASGLGAFSLLWAMALAGWAYMGRSERWVVGAALGLLVALPFVAQVVGQRTAFAGTRGEAVWLVERGALEQGALEELKALDVKGEAPFPVLFALGREERRRAGGQAVPLLRRAAQLRPDSVEAAVELGNALLLSGELDGAGEAYQRAAAQDPGRSEPAFNLARLFARKGQVARDDASASLARAQEYTRQAIDLDPRLGPRLSEPDYRANRFVAPAPLPVGPMLDLAVEEASDARIGDQVASRLFGPLRYSRVPAAALSVMLLVAAGVLFGALRPSAACSKCGRPACRRCDAEVVGPGLCGQCLHVFAQRGAVDPPARLSKELGIKRFQRRREIALKTSSLLAGAAHVLSGRTLAGALMLALAFACGFEGFEALFSREVVPVPAGELPPMLRAGPAAVVVFALVAVSVRHACCLFRPGPTTGAQPAAATRQEGPADRS
jgi:tetratricopeptide (TPR) repeat protein